MKTAGEINRILARRSKKAFRELDRLVIWGPAKRLNQAYIAWVDAGRTPKSRARLIVALTNAEAWVVLGRRVGGR
jgi:hypothetical protein